MRPDFAFDSCTRFGWRRVLKAPVAYAWTDGVRFATVRRDGSGVDVFGPQPVSVDNAEVTRVVGNAHTIVAFGLLTSLVSIDGARFNDINAPVGLPITDLQIEGDGTLDAARGKAS